MQYFFVFNRFHEVHTGLSLSYFKKTGFGILSNLNNIGAGYCWPDFDETFHEIYGMQEETFEYLHD